MRDSFDVVFDAGAGKFRHGGEESVLLRLLEDGGECGGGAGDFLRGFAGGCFVALAATMVCDERGVGGGARVLERVEGVAESPAGDAREDAEGRARLDRLGSVVVVLVGESVETRLGVGRERANRHGEGLQPIDGATRGRDERFHVGAGEGDGVGRVVVGGSRRLGGRNHRGGRAEAREGSVRWRGWFARLGCPRAAIDPEFIVSNRGVPTHRCGPASRWSVGHFARPPSRLFLESTCCSIAIHVSGSPSGRLSTLVARVASPSDPPTMSPALLGSGAFLSPRPLAAPSPRPPRRARVLHVAPVAKGQKGVRKIVQAPGQEQFPPGTALSKMMNLRLNKINWKVLSDASDKLDGELASQPILGLVRAEVLLRGVDELQREGRGYKEYILLRSLGLKAWFTMATSRAGIVDPVERCAVGKALADPAGEHNIYRRVLARAPLAAAGDWIGFADGLAADARAAADAVTEEDTKTVKVRYDAGVTAAHFEFIEAEIAAAAKAARDAKKGDDATTAVVLVPWTDPGAAPKIPDAAGTDGAESATSSSASASASAPSSAAPPAAAEDDDNDVESMFGKKSKKKKKAGAGAAALAAAAAAGGGKMPSLDAVLSQLAKKQAEPTFPDVSAWCVGAAQATGSEAIAAASATALASPPGAVVVVPSRLFASALTFDLGVLGEDRVVISAARAAKEDVAAWGGKEDAAVVFVSFDPSEDDAAERAARDAAAKAVAAGRPVVAAAVALAPGGKCDAVEGPEGAEEARKGAEARLRRRLGL